MKETGGETASLISDEHRELFNFNEAQIEGLQNSVDDDSPDIKDITPMTNPTTSHYGLKSEKFSKNYFSCLFDRP